MTYYYMIIGFALVISCKKTAVSNLAVDGSVAIPPPPVDLRAGASFALGQAGNRCVRNPDGTWSCGGEEDNGFKIPDPSPSKKTPTPPASSTPTTTSAEADTEAKPIYTPDNKQFYRPLKGFDGYFQNYHADGTPTGFYWDKAGNKLFKFDENKTNVFDPTTKKPVFNDQSQIYNLKAENGVWRGDLVDTNDTPTGVFYQYGMRNNADKNWDFVFGVDPKLAQQASQPNPVAQQFLGQTSTQYFSQFPSGDTKPITIADITAHWFRPPVNQDPGLFSPGGGVQSQNSFNSPGSSRYPQGEEWVRVAQNAGRRVVYVSSGSGCPPCEQLKAYLQTPAGRQSGITLQYVSKGPYPRLNP